MKSIPVKIPNVRASTRALVDDEDYEILKGRRWSMNSKGYARTGFTNRVLFPNKRQLHVRMHRVVMWSPDGMIIDHIDGNVLNNQKSNLRVCTQEENKRNSSKSLRNTSGYKGVARHRNKTWLAYISVNGKTKNVGSFKNKIDAALAYNEAAKKYYGEFARLNVINYEE